MDSIRTFNDLAATIRGRRLQLGWSQQALADAAGVSRSWIARFEAGRSSSEVALLMRVLDALSLEMRIDAPGSGVPPAPGAAVEADTWDLDDVIRDLTAP